MKNKLAGLKNKLEQAEQRVTPADREFRFVVIDHNGNETGEAMIVRPNKPTEFYTYTPKPKEAQNESA